MKSRLRKSLLRKDIGGASADNDRLWRVVAPNFVAGFTEYNDEITGCAPILKKWCPYSGHASYAIKKMREAGFKIKEVEDRFIKTKREE